MSDRNETAGPLYKRLWPEEFTEAEAKPRPVYRCPKCKTKAEGEGWCYCRTPPVRMVKAS